MSKPKRLDVNHALVLRSQGLTWDEIGRRLARKIGRVVPYQGHSVQDAVARTKVPEPERDA